MSTILVIGGGLAGATAALVARRAGHRVVLCAGSPGATAMWHGRLNLLGPGAFRRGDNMPGPFSWTNPAVSRDIGHESDRADPTGVPSAQRLSQVLQRRPDHPYNVLGLGLDGVVSKSVQALSELGLGQEDAPIVVEPGHAMISDAGTVVVGDGGAATTVATQGEPTAWLGLPATHQHFPQHLAVELCAAQTGKPELSTIVVESMVLPPRHGLPMVLSSGPNAHPELLDVLCSSIEGQEQVLVPPIFGTTFSAARDWCKALTERTGAVVVERQAVDEPVFGLRLVRYLTQQLDAAGVERRGPLSPIAHSGPAEGTLREVEVAGETIAVDGVVLATGRYLGGGIARQPPWRETIFGLPLYFEGQVLDQGITATELLGSRPWSDHAAFTTGIATDAMLRPLDRRQRVKYDNLWACGRVLTGTSPVLDATAHGVDLTTGLLAGRACAGLM